MLLADGFEDAFIGVGARCGCPDIAVYDVEKCIASLMGQGMTDEEATEYFEFNVLGSWVGEATPLFLYRGEQDI
jgi:hypothetical protein